MRFNTGTYSPAQDSSADTDGYRTQGPEAPGYDGVILLTTAVVDGTAVQACGCGCQVPTKPGRMFVQGHDQRLRGILTRAHLAEVEVTRIDGGHATTGSALTLALQLDAERPLGKQWAAGLRAATELQARLADGKAQRAAKRAAVSRETDAAVAEAAEVGAAEAAASTPEPTYRDGTAKVGRWTYPARVWEGGVAERNTSRKGEGTWVEIDASQVKIAE